MHDVTTHWYHVRLAPFRGKDLSQEVVPTALSVGYVFLFVSVSMSEQFKAIPYNMYHLHLMSRSR